MTATLPEVTQFLQSPSLKMGIGAQWTAELARANRMAEIIGLVPLEGSFSLTTGH